MDRRYRCGDCKARLDDCECWNHDITIEVHEIDLQKALSHLTPYPEVPL